ncbi:mannose-6-phosphate isomerase 2-like [Phalaenopsis equestris]|uniref:mannose-6-phosphate isomerase 2-like n=1 Tax=Phalaenopsis equestris TaxID=78828 RepID=UPI0009E2EAE4|nr:mannose-6-phosphate isomerase 2-like [Phalaenopsis equestris]
MEAVATAEARRPLRLRCSVKNYDWGMIGQESMVGRLFALNSKQDIEAGKPYAELWMGTHESGPSFVDLGQPEGERLTLKSLVEENPSVLGEKVVKRWGMDLPFLFKALSVGKALSIQAHPDKELAGFLHKTHPELYKDPNHKPEMAIALSEFKALCGFVSVKELKDVLTHVPEILELVGEESAIKFMKIQVVDGNEVVKALLQSMFTTLMTASKEAISEALKKLLSRLGEEQKVRVLTVKEELVLLLEKQYPADVGVIAAFFFNYVKLSPGEALCINANEPHAYVSGECIECMATSDNVVRAGLTAKYRDVQTLCSMLTYKQGLPEILNGDSLNPYIKRYAPPFDEFEVDYYLIPSGESVVSAEISGPSILLIISGDGRLQMGVASVTQDVSEGNVFFVPSQIEISFSAGVTRPLQIYRAGVNSQFFDQ